MNKAGKRAVIGGVVAALVVGAVGGGYFLTRNRSSEPISVYSFQDVGMEGYWGDESQAYGQVTADQVQSVYVSTTQIVKEVYVEEGQEVHVGDPLLSYDSTLSELQLNSKDLEVKKAELALKKAQDELKKIQSYRPGVPVVSADVQPENWGVLAASADVQHGNQGVLAASDDTKPEPQRVLTAQIGAVGPNLVRFLIPADETLPTSAEDETTAGETTAADQSSEDLTEPESSGEETTAPETTEPESTEPESTEPETTAPETTEPETTAPVPETIPELPEADRPTFVKGLGNEKMPNIYLWKENQVISPSMLQYLLDGKDSVMVALMVREEDKLIGAHLYTYLYEIKMDGKTPVMQPKGYMAGEEEDPMTVYTGEEETTPEETLPGFEDPGFDGPIGITYTSAEIAKMLSDKELEIKGLDIQLKVAQVEYQKMETEVHNDTIYSEVDGVVKSVGDVEESAVNHTPVLTVSGGGGYYIETSIGELDLETVKIGQTVQINSWESGQVLEGEVYSISPYPQENANYYGGMGNSNVSYYPFTVFVSEDADLREGEYVDITYSAASEGEADSLYLTNAFIRQEDGKNYVMVAGADDTLEKRFVSVGKNLWGSYTQIRSGLTNEDRVAFPYGSDVKEGAPVVDGSMEDFYNSMYGY